MTRHDPPIPGVTLFGGDEDNGMDRGLQNFHHGGEDVDLRRAPAGPGRQEATTMPTLVQRRFRWLAERARSH